MPFWSTFKIWQVSQRTAAIAGAVSAGLMGAIWSTGAHAEELTTKAPKAFLYEPGSGTVLFAKDADLPFSPGALVKVMTAATVFKALFDGDMTLDQLCRVSEHAWRTGGAPSGRGATMFAAIKSEIAVEDLLKGLLVHNGNDAAIILAECLDGSEEAFAGRMNKLAADIGMVSSRFGNPTGYEEAVNTTTVRDQAWLAEYVIEEHAELYKMFAIPEFTWNKIFQRNKNPLLGEIRNLDGLGGGRHSTDGFSGLGSIDRNGRRIIASVAGLKSDKHRLATLKEIFEGAWEFYAVQTVFAAGETVIDGRVYGGTSGSVPLVAAENIDVFLPRDGALEYRLRVVYQGPLVAPVKEGVTVGELRVVGKDGIVHRAPLKTGNAVPEGGLVGKALDSVQELLFGWIG
ncbi:D-alanyl-D-alanine carboxypeptidase family protein [Roseibium sp.]|uniref:D-alanyl-D-alanine carboxypeptidase family protein n=1 Tax=Roseibium sp. TaxID=1936156 RepID=UPI003B519BF7